jgi:hypothetical protein
MTLSGIKVHACDWFAGSDRTKCSLIMHEFLKIDLALLVECDKNKIEVAFMIYFLFISAGPAVCNA